MTDTTAPQPPRRPVPVFDAADFPPAEQPGDVAFEPAPLAGTRRTDPARVIPHRPKADVHEWAASDDRIPVFTVQHEDGSHTTYTMPSKPNPGIALAFLRDVRTQGDAALIGLFELVLDAGAVDALIDEVSAMDADEAAKTLQTINERVQRNLGGNLKR